MSKKISRQIYLQTCWLLGPSNIEPTWCQLRIRFWKIGKYLWASRKSTQVSTPTSLFHFRWQSSRNPSTERSESKWSSGCKLESWMVIAAFFSNSSVKIIQKHRARAHIHTYTFFLHLSLSPPPIPLSRTLLLFLVLHNHSPKTENVHRQEKTSTLREPVWDLGVLWLKLPFALLMSSSL